MPRYELQILEGMIQEQSMELHWMVNMNFGASTT